jgi:hypothetical protein
MPDRKDLSSGTRSHGLRYVRVVGDVAPCNVDLPVHDKWIAPGTSLRGEHSGEKGTGNKKTPAETAGVEVQKSRDSGRNLLGSQPRVRIFELESQLQLISRNQT